MSLKTSNENNKLYAKIFAALTLTVSITLFSLTTILYANFESILRDRTYSLIANNLRQVSQEAEFMASTAKNLSLQVYNDWAVSKLLNYTLPLDEEISTAVFQLAYYRATTPYIDSIYVYNAKAGIFYISSNKTESVVENEAFFSDKEVIKYFNSSYLFTPIPRQIPINSNIKNKDSSASVYTTIYSTLISGSQKPGNAVVINISDEWVKKFTDGFNEKLESNTFIINSEARVISGTYKYPMLSSLSNEEFIKTINKSKLPSGYFISRVNHSDSLVSYIFSSSLGWTFIQITPYKMIVDKIKDLRNNTILIGIIILLLGLLVSYMLSRKLYKPMDNIISRLKKLEVEKKDNFYTLKQEFLRNILKESKELELKVIQKKFSDFEIKIDCEGKILLILLVIDHFKDFYDQYNANDRNIFKFAVMNTATEICSKYCLNASVDMGDNRIALILNVADNDIINSYCSIFEDVIKQIQVNVFNYLKISLSATVSIPGDTINSIGMLYGNVLEASLHRMLYGHGCIIFAEKIIEFKSNNYIFPIHKEKLLIDNIMSGKMDEVKKIYTEIVSGMKEYSYMTINFNLSRLAFSINMAICTIQKNNLLSSHIDVNIINIFLNSVETIEEFNNHLFQIFDNISIKLHIKSNVSQELAVGKIVEIINNDYINPNLSIDFFASLLGMSPSYISRLFKKERLKTINEYINEVRMNKARELLLNTGIVIEKVAEKTGFTSSIYFHTSFKKCNGVTPGEFRLKHRIGN